MESQKKHNVGAGFLVAASGLPLYKGAAKFSRVSGLLGKSGGAGHKVADYIEASGHILNEGITGKIAGVALRNPTHPAVKWALGKAPALSELGGSKGLNKVAREHFSAFRSSHTGGLDAWTEELINHWDSKNPKISNEIRKHAATLQGHLGELWNKGYNEKEALRHAADDPRHQKLFTRMIAYKADVVPTYAKITAGLAAAPLTAGAAIAATKRKTSTKQLAAKLEELTKFAMKPSYPVYPEPEDDEPFRLSPGVKKTAAIGGAAIGVPGLLYARGLRSQGVPWTKVPQVLKGDIRSGSVGSITGTMRAGATGLWGGAKGSSRAVWEALKNAGRGLRQGLSANDPLIQLNAKLDDLIEFRARYNLDDEQKKSKFPKLATLYGAGALTGAGIATGSAATRQGMTYAGKKLGSFYRFLRGK